ncbi:MAG: hypothetical protein HOQ02_10400 [Lysobacter sp.]|nr:hypothetical protein [Lysobacter sp.]
MIADVLSKPERSCARDQARDIRDLVREDGGCCYCTRRLGIFESVGRRALCGLTPPKQFPACVGTDAGFDFDEPAFREGAGRNLR